MSDAYIELVKKTWAAYQAHEKAKKAATEIYKDLERLKSKLIETMDVLGIQKQELSDFGRLSITNRFSVPMPEKEDKEAFFAYLKERGIFDNMASVNSKTLQAWYKDEINAAIEEGDIDFKIPGITAPKYTDNEPKYLKSITFTKNKG